MVGVMVQGYQFVPPSAVCSTVPPLPTAMPFWASAKLMSRRSALPEASWLSQVAPPSVVLRITSLFGLCLPLTMKSPVTQPVLASTKQTERSDVESAGSDWIALQLFPPLLVVYTGPGDALVHGVTA